MNAAHDRAIIFRQFTVCTSNEVIGCLLHPFLCALICNTVLSKIYLADERFLIVIFSTFSDDRNENGADCAAKTACMRTVHEHRENVNFKL